MNKHTITLTIQKTGLHTNIQDTGRIGYQEFGVPSGGVMDRTAAATANWLVGNPATTPLIEITLMGPSIRIQGSAQIALTGANLSPQLNKGTIPMYETLTINKEATLSFGKAINGCRTYLAIGGDWQVQEWLGSSSAATTTPSTLTPDSVLQKNSQLKIQPRFFLPKRIYEVNLRPIYSDPAFIKVVPGPEFELFSPYAIASFFSQTYTISNDSNRMGYRLIGKDLKIKLKREVISSGIVPGTIQISNSGQAILLMRDAQTTGGYPRIANVISKDLDTVAQLRPREGIRFELKQKGV